MPARDFDHLVADVAAVCVRHGLPAWFDSDFDRLAAALWAFAHPDLAGTQHDPYTDDYSDDYSGDYAGPEVVRP